MTSTAHSAQQAAPIIRATGLLKAFNGRDVVCDIDLAIGSGEIFGLLGPNGAGKTTTIRLLCGLLTCDAGAVEIAGCPVSRAKSRFGYVAQHFGQYEELSVAENLRFYARMYGVRDQNRLDAILERYGLWSFRQQRAGELSGGYQRRLAVACALAHDPDILFLDEPTAGIDPVTRKLLWEDFYELAAEGKALIITTHYMEEAQRCHQLAFLSAGRIVAQGSPTSIAEALGDAQVFSINAAYRPAIHQALSTLNGVILVNQFGEELRIVAEPTVRQNELLQTIRDVGGGECEVQTVSANLEDVFIALTHAAGAQK